MGQFSPILRLLTVCLIQFSLTTAFINAAPQSLALQRALADGEDGYSPVRGPCPANPPYIRVADSVSPEEQAWLRKRRANTRQPMRELLARSAIPQFDAAGYIDRLTDDTSLPNIGLAMSGGGYRALLLGAGVLSAFDNRTAGANDRAAGGLGGLLQSATYLSGLSGGGWLVGSLYVNNFTSVEDILAGSAAGDTRIWDFDRSMLEGPRKSWFPGEATFQYWRHMLTQVIGKKRAGFETSLTDYWSRGLAYQMINSSHGGPAYTFSSIAKQPGFPEGEIPMPMIVACGRQSGQLLVPRNTTIFEFNPWEMGSWDPSLYGMAPLKYVGSHFEGGKLADGDQCVTGFDNAAFIMGTSSTLFNAVVSALYNLKFKGILASVADWIHDLAAKLDGADDDIADWTPNPFKGWKKHRDEGYDGDSLGLVDGGEAYQNIPLYPHLQPYRKVDVVFAVDASADSGNLDGWPNGTSLVATWERHQDADMANGTAFPSIPDVNTFINLGLNQRPTFFGCDARNITSGPSGPPPIVVYIPNAPYTFYSNISTKTTTVNDKERNAAIRNGYHVATMGNGTLEAEWPVCVSCAILSRSFDRTGTTPPAACASCFQKHCWNGTLDSKQSPQYTPKLLMPQYADQNATAKGDHNKKSGAVSEARVDWAMMSLSLLLFGVTMLPTV